MPPLSWTDDFPPLGRSFLRMAASAQQTITFAVGGPIARDDLPGLCKRVCALMEMGIDCILFSVGWPFVDNEPGTRWMETVPLSAVDREKVLSGNARRLLKM